MHEPSKTFAVSRKEKDGDPYQQSAVTERMTLLALNNARVVSCKCSA